VLTLRLLLAEINQYNAYNVAVCKDLSAASKKVASVVSIFHPPSFVLDLSSKIDIKNLYGHEDKIKF